MGVRVDKAREEEHSGAVDGLCRRAGDIRGDLQDLLALHQYIGPLGAAAGDDGAAFE